jgi:TolB protein
MILKRILSAALVLSLALLAPSPSGAKVYIDINAASIKRVPVAVPVLKTSADYRPGRTSDEPQAVIAETLRRDLDFVGVFEVLDPKKYLEDPQTAEMVPTTESFSSWYVSGAELLVKGQVDQEGEELVVDLFAYDVFRREFLFGKRYRGGRDTVGNMAHMFANAMLEKFTGKAGPFGSEIAYVSQKGNAKEIVRSKLNESGPPIPVTNNGSLNLHPAWSRNNRSIYLSSYFGGVPDLCRVNLGEGVLRYVYKGEGLDMPGEESPDGRTLSFASSSGGNTDIYTLDLRTRNVTRLTSGNSINVSPTWSPDGKKLAFVSDRKGSPNIFVMDAGGSEEPKRITFSGAHNGDPAWSPDGEKIAFSGMDEKGVFQVFITDPEGGKISQATFGSYDTLEPSWSPDGRFLAVTSRKDGDEGVYVLRVGSSAMRRVSPVGVKASQPSWSYGDPTKN